jgi:hypothetical protein
MLPIDDTAINLNDSDIKPVMTDGGIATNAVKTRRVRSPRILWELCKGNMAYLGKTLALCQMSSNSINKFENGQVKGYCD